MGSLPMAVFDSLQPAVRRAVNRYIQPIYGIIKRALPGALVNRLLREKFRIRTAA